MLIVNALSKLLAGLGIVMLLLFLPAGTWCYWQAWLFIALLFIPMTLVGIWLLFRQPDLLAKRLNNKEKQTKQKSIVALSGVMFILGFVLCGLDARYAWSDIPLWLIICASVLFLLGYAIYVEVMRENAYLSRTIEVQEGQRVIDSGLYSIVRHPMYSATLLMYLAMPLILGSAWALLVFAIYPLLIIQRIHNEETLLAAELPGYTDYQQRIRYRLIPWIW
jgi:protein-S-isoprenylcysteine O-methyltransferase Ste14